ncbi:ParB/RepB/Spo0J family partition protein [Intestinimonas massiliensis (ex Afouda et al. 2020)]|uniref:ParB/RepB/Spo0J family partition protein n=1 Tax=Intestinimonas massiliensis (ex Afouda et al. 2020) TaxID=1673721 RepID=UPI00102F361E
MNGGNQMANEPRKPQIVPLAKIHDLPGVFIPKVQDKAYGGLVTSIQVSGVKEAVILRLREDGEYQLVDGYRRRRASELAKKKDIPALVYKMTLQEAIEYHKKVKGQPTLPVPGVLVNTPTETQEPLKGDKVLETEKKPEQTVPAAPGKKADEPAPKAEQTTPKEGRTPEGEKKPEQATPATPGKKADEPAPKAEQATPREGKSPETEKKPEQAVPAAPGKKADEPAPKAEQTVPKEGKAPEGEKKPEQAVPAAPGKKADEPAPKAEQATPKEGKSPETEKKPEQTIPVAPDKKADERAPKAEQPTPKAEQTAPKEGKSPEAEKKPEQTIPAAPGKKTDEPAPKAEQTAPKEGKTLEAEKKSEAVAKAVGMAAKGPAGTQITQVFEDRLSPPDDKALKNLPTPKEGESYFIVLHPGYLEKSKFNTVSVDQNSEDYRELKKSIELNGVKDPVLTRINPDGGLEILSGQRRHMIARELNYPVPAIIQKIDDADAKILVSDGNLHRPKISTYDLSRTLRMKMEGMKQKAGRRKKGFTAEELNSDEKLAKEMGMSVSKLNRIIRLSEASKEVCNRVDDGTLPLSAASALSFLKPENQDVALHLTDLGYKLPTERIEYLKKVEKAGKLDEITMRKVLDGENVLEPPKVVSFPGTETPQPAKGAPPSNVPTHEIIPPAPTPGSEPSKEKTPVEPAGVSAAPEPVATTPTTTPPTAPTPTMTPTPPEKPAQTPAQEKDPFKGEQERPEYTKVILAGDRLRRYFPDVNMTPRQIEESVYEALEERRQRLEKQKQKEAILKKGGPTR